MPYVIGLTGGIGSGKSAAADIFEKLGAHVVDTDAISHELTQAGGAAISAIRSAFGGAVITQEGALDRAAMRTLAFADPRARAQLEAILHPLIRKVSAARVAAADGLYVVLVVPLLIESRDYRERVQRVAVVDCSEQTQIDRVVRRSGLGAEQVRAVMAAQASRAERLAAADDVIDNEGDHAALAAQIAVLDARYRALAAQTR
jgi:dephospho-CoA kinase